MACSIICCLDYTDADSVWITQKLRDTGVHFAITRCVPKNKLERYLKFINLARVRAGFEAVILAKKSNATGLISIGPAAAAWCAIFCLMFGLQTKIIAHAFNFAHLPKGIKRIFFSFALKRVTRFIVFSKIEKSIYSCTFGIPIDRFDFLFCDAQPSEVKQRNIPFIEGNYVSVIGGNARDFGILLDAARKIPELRFVLVVRPESLQGFSIPENVRAYVNLPFDITMNVLLHSQFMILPLLNSSVPCGHVTIACAMHLGKAIAVSGSTGVADYILDDINGLAVPTGDTTALVKTIRRLADDLSLRERLGEAGRSFAKEMCSEEKTVSYFRRLCAELCLV